MSTNKRIAQSDKLAGGVEEYRRVRDYPTGQAASLVASEALRQAVIALVEQQALANRIALGDFDRDELLKFLNA